MRASKSLLQLVWLALRDKVLVLQLTAVADSLVLELIQEFGKPQKSGGDVGLKALLPSL
jgi:Ca2+-transporting ATPase